MGGTHLCVCLWLCVLPLSDRAMKVLLSSVDSREMVVRSMGASALWALLHNSQKVTHAHRHAHAKPRTRTHTHARI